MIRLAHLSDSHFDERGRLQDTIDVHRAFVEQAAKEQVDLVVHAGDFFERRSTALEREALADFLESCGENHLTVFGVKGNHDAPRDLPLFNRLDVTQHGRYGAEVMLIEYPNSTAPWFHDVFRVGGGVVAVLALYGLPWFDKAHLVAGLDVSEDAGTTRERTNEAARRLLEAYRQDMADRVQTGTRNMGVGGEIPIIPVLVSHALVAGSEVSSGQVLIGTTVELAPSDLLATGAAYVALGHVHKAQEWHGGRVAYSGSVNRCNFGEPEAKGWRLVTLTDEGDFLSSEFRELPTRPMVFIDIDWRAGVPPYVPFHEMAVEGALMRVRYRIRAGDLAAADEPMIRRVLEGAGAHEVKIEAVVEAETRARAPELAQATTTWEKVETYFGAKGIELESEQAARLEAKVGELERP
jgi:exonuclease SbcD